MAVEESSPFVGLSMQTKLIRDSVCTCNVGAEEPTQHKLP